MIPVLAGLARWRWLLPLSWLLAIWWSLTIDPLLIQGRSLNAAIQGVQVVMFLAPATAVAGALAGASLRGNKGRMLTSARPTVALAAGVCGVHALIAASALTLSSLLVRVSTSATGFEGWEVISLATLTVTGASAVGQALGRHLPEVVAAPIALLGSYVVLTLPRTFGDPLWLRHLAFVDSCCNSVEEVSPRVLGAIAAMATATVTAGLLTTLRRHRLVGMAVGAAALVIGWTVSTSLVQDLGWSPATARTGQVVCIGAQQEQVCVWPENSAALDELAAAWTRLRQTAEEQSLDLPTRVTERAGGEVHYGDGLMSLTPDTPVAHYPEVVVLGALPSMDRCIVDGTMDSRIDNAWLSLAQWWMDTAGFTRSEQLIDPPHAYLDVPEAELSARLQELIDSIRACDPSGLP